VSYKLIKETEEVKIVYEIKAEDLTWPEMIEEFKTFLRGCGYFIDEDNNAETETRNDTSQTREISRRAY
jgi:hypothetical protein